MDLVSYDFGFPLPGSTLTHSFVVTNHSDRQLQFLNIETSCGCTAAKLDKKLLEPGDVAVLKLTARVPVYAEDWAVQTIVKANEGGAAKELRFNLTAKVANLIEFSDAAPCFDLGDHKLDDLPLGKIITIRRGANPIEWEEIRCKSDNPNLKATVVRDGTQGWSLTLEWSGIDCLGAMIGSLEFSFWKGSKELDYHVTRRALIRVAGPVCVSPLSLLIGVVERGQSVRTTVRLSESPDQSMPFEIVDVKMNDRQHIRTGIRKEASEQIVTVEYLAGETPREDSGELLITVKADKIYKIRIPYLAKVIDGPSASGVAH